MRRMDDRRTFQIEEYKSLRKEIEVYLAEARSQERYVVIGVGAIWAWLLAHNNHENLPWLMPVFLTAAVALRSFGIDRHFKQLKRYLCLLEKEFDVNGWEHQERKFSVGAASNVLALILLLLTVIAFLLR